MLKNFFKRIFPAPAKRTQLQYEDVQARLDKIEHQQQLLMQTLQDGVEHLCEQMNGVSMRIMDHDNDVARRITDANRDINHQLDDMNSHIIGDLQHLTGLCQSAFVCGRGSAEAYDLLRHIKRLQEHFHVALPQRGAFRRFGRAHDGGYLMLDDFAGREIAYSFGISNDVSWDRAMADQGLDIYMYDHTIERLPEERPQYHWQKIGLAGKYDAACPKLHTLEQILLENGHQKKKKMILKMDIEGAEWDVLRFASPQIWGQFSQIVFEMHGLNDLAQEENIIEALTHLNETQQLVHVHGNNWESYAMADGRVMPDALECTYLNKEEYAFQEEAVFLPTRLDEANNPWKPDIVLGNWGSKQDEP